MRVQKYAYLPQDTKIVAEFLEDLDLIGEIEGIINPSFKAGGLYALPRDISLELNRQGYCIVCQKMTGVAQ